MTKLPPSWKISKIGDVAEVIRGVTYSKADTLSQNDKNSVPLLRATNLEVDAIDFNDMVYVPKEVVKEQQYLRIDDIFLAASSGSISVVGKSAQVVKTNGATFGAFCSVIRPKTIHAKFLALWVQSPEIRDYWSATAKGTNINNLKTSDILDTSVPLPPLPEQQKIVEILEDHLSRLNAALADVKQAKLKAAQFRRSLLQAAFTGNLTGDGTSLMTELPNGWHLTTIGEVCEKPKYGWTTSASDIGEVKLLRTTDLTHGPITWETVPFCKEIPKTVADYLVHPNDIFISRAGSVGVSVLVKDAPYKSVFASYLIRIRPNKKIDSKYLSLFLQSPHYWNQVTELSSGIALANINATKIQSINLPLPPLPEQQKIVEILEDHLLRLDTSVAIADAMEKQSSSLRRSLLQAAFTGQLTKEVASV